MASVSANATAMILLFGTSAMDLSSTLVRKLAEPIGVLDPKPPVRPILQFIPPTSQPIRPHSQPALPTMVPSPPANHCKCATVELWNCRTVELSNCPTAQLSHCRVVQLFLQVSLRNCLIIASLRMCGYQLAIGVHFLNKTNDKLFHACCN